MNTVLITGANRGLGLEFARQYLADGWHVLAACRNPDAAGELRALEGPGKRDILHLDVSAAASFADFAGTVADKVPALDLLINNAGIYPRGNRWEDLSPAAMEDAFRVNTVGPVFLTRALVPLLQRAQTPVVINISSGMGSISSKAEDGPGGDIAYSVSKAALNMAVRLLANELKGMNITVIAQCPGWVQTDMGGKNASLTPVQSISAMKATFAKLNIEATGRYQDRHGAVIAY